MSDPLDTQQLLLVGLPRAGKTTFVAAFWHVVSSGELPEALKVTSLGGDDEYLNLIRDSWISYQALERTSQHDEAIPQINLADSSESRRCILLVPDLSGETYRSQWVTREWTEKFDNLAKGSSALVIFVHPCQNIEPTEITATLRLLPGENDDSTQEEESGGEKDSVVPGSSNDPADGNTEPIWDSGLANDVVQLVDVLQAFQERVNRPLRIAVVISAWDLVDAYFETPEAYLKNKVSLLAQYLSSNADVITSTVYGVSATGTSLDNKQECIRLQNETKVASERIQVINESRTDHDITRPLRWALEW